MYQDLVVKKELVPSITSYHWGLKQDGMLVVAATLKTEKDHEKVYAEVKKAFDVMIKKGVSEKELKIAKINIQSDILDGLTSIAGKAQSLAYQEIMTGDYRNLTNDITKYEEITQADVLRVAKQYLDVSKRIVVLQVPEQTRTAADSVVK